MKIRIICFTKNGIGICKNLVEQLDQKGYHAKGYIKSKYRNELEKDSQIVHTVSLIPVESSLNIWTGEMFRQSDAIIFIGACGIAVRAIAPYLVHKGKDPAVIVIDEKGNYAISLLSGHIGGANKLTTLVSGLIGAVPVITTATDINNRFSVDTFAAREKLVLDDFGLAKDISAVIVNGGEVELYSDFPIASSLPDGLCHKGEYRVGEVSSPCIYVTIKDSGSGKNCEINLENTLVLTPKIVVLGIGCKKNISAEVIEKRIDDTLNKHNISPKAVLCMASIDLKAEEKGILEYTKKHNLEFKTYSAEQLIEVEGEFHSSTFVERTTGVDNICERSAVLASGFGQLIIPKSGKDGVTTAVAIKEWSVKFE